jgi:DNA-binding LacI/PurR family transcriptional regulator
MTSSHVTIRDVAARAGVSHQTVSRVINRSERVNPETREKVETAIAELDYRPNATARFLNTGYTHPLACLSPNITDFTFASIIEGAETEARQQGYFFISSSAPNETGFSLLVEELVNSRRTDGMMVINPYIDDRSSLFPGDTPTVLLGARPRSEEFDTVCLNDEEAGRTATQHLVDLGHHQIAHITGPMREDCSQDRCSGYREVLWKAGITPNPALLLEGDWSATSGYQVVKRLLQNGIHFTALFAQNDRMAVGAIRALREAGKNVPQDVSVVGFDDMPLASYFDPPLTTMRQDTVEMGRQAARLLIESVDKPQSIRRHVYLSAELVVRGSTAPLDPAPDSI